MTVFSLLMLAVYAIVEPPLSVSRSVRIDARSLLVRAVPEPSFLIASPNVSVMSVVLSVSVSPLAGLNVGSSASSLSIVTVAVEPLAWRA